VVRRIRLRRGLPECPRRGFSEILRVIPATRRCVRPEVEDAPKRAVSASGSALLPAASAASLVPDPSLQRHRGAGRDSTDDVPSLDLLIAVSRMDAPRSERLAAAMPAIVYGRRWAWVGRSKTGPTGETRHCGRDFGFRQNSQSETYTSTACAAGSKWTRSSIRSFAITSSALEAATCTRRARGWTSARLALAPAAALQPQPPREAARTPLRLGDLRAHLAIV